MPLPVATRWFDSYAVSEALSVITEPFVHPFLQANIWHLRGSDRDLVVDTGLGVGSLSAHLPTLFEHDPVVVITHSHLDHLGGAHEFAACFAHPAERVQEARDVSLRGPELTRLLQLGPSATAEPLPDLLIDALPRQHYSVEDYRVVPVAADPIGDGDRIDLGDRAFTILHLPGHSPGSIGLFDEAAGELFSGDVIYRLRPGEHLLDDLAGGNRTAYVASLKRLAELPIRVVYPGHGEPFESAELRAIIEGYLAADQRAERSASRLSNS